MVRRFAAIPLHFVHLVLQLVLLRVESATGQPNGQLPLGLPQFDKRRRTDYKKPAVIGPTHLVYPRNEGWRPKGQKGKTENGSPRKLITIHGITDHLTKRITRKIKPNCIRNWKKRVRFRIDFKKVFSSFGTPLSNDAEQERQWRKYVHLSLIHI